ncbi:MAG: ABC transporter permease [Opitutae bacterium]|nr:ABC transporter permease [Opitutae bacterium]
MLADLRFAFRSLSKTPGFTLVAVLTMAIAIGACTALFSVLQAVVLRPLPYPHPETLVSVWAKNATRNLEAPALSWAKYEFYRQRTDVFQDVSMSASNSFTLTEGRGEPEQVNGWHVTANFLPILGLQPIRGRNFTAEEDSDAGPNVAMISRRLWETRFSSDPRILGRVVQIDGVGREVVGVLPDLPLPFNGTDVVVPKAADLPYFPKANRDNGIVHQAIARLAPGVSLPTAQLRVNEMAKQFRADRPNHVDAENENELRTVTQQVLGNLDRTFWTLAGAVAAVLLIACANIANLFLARVSARQKEIAVRLSLGARRAEVIRQFLAESAVFTCAAGVLGVLFAWWSLRAIQVIAGPQLPRADEIALDPLVLAFSLGTALAAAVLIGVYPAWQASRTDVGTVLKDNTRGAGGGTAAKAFRHFLVVAQVALSLTLLICAGLLVLSFYKLQNSALGFAVEGRALGQINLPAARYGKPEANREFYRQLQQKIDEAPELAGGGVAFGMPLTQAGFISPFAVQGRPIPDVTKQSLANMRFASVGYFNTMGIRLLEGRFFNAQDRADGERVIVINETLAKKLFPGESALDHVLLNGPNSATKNRIVGVIRDVKAAGLAAPPPEEIYIPALQRAGAFMNVVAVARPGLSASTVIPVLRRLVKEIDPTLAVAQPQTMEQLVEQSIGVQRVTMALLLTFAAIAALLAAVGVYSVMAYAVTQRTGEIGVRMALGASPASILGLVLRTGATQVGSGLALGLLGAFAASRLLQDGLYQVQPFDPLVFSAVAAFFAIVATLACLVPAARATRVNPLDALRAE